jgi:hypothetical protein
MLDKELPGWKKKYYALVGLEPKPLTPEVRKKIQEFIEQIRALPSYDGEDAD